MVVHGSTVFKFRLKNLTINSFGPADLTADLTLYAAPTGGAGDSCGGTALSAPVAYGKEDIVIARPDQLSSKRLCVDARRTSPGLVDASWDFELTVEGAALTIIGNVKVGTGRSHGRTLLTGQPMQIDGSTVFMFKLKSLAPSGKIGTLGAVDLTLYAAPSGAVGDACGGTALSTPVSSGPASFGKEDVVIVSPAELDYRCLCVEARRTSPGTAEQSWRFELIMETEGS
jgi:hypothetical protein